MALWPFRQKKKAMEQASEATVEGLLAQINELAQINTTDVPETLCLWFASNLTWQQSAVAPDLAMAIVLDALLGKQFMPNGFTQAEGGRWYEYVREPAV